MDKLGYLRKVFAHTKGKTFENYVINQIWSKVEDLGLYPVTQQYVKRPDGYALLDLYFPQINFAVEVNENYHKNIIKSDEMRIVDIFGSIPEIKVEPIKEGSYDSVKAQIYDVVKKIESIVNKIGPFKWDENWKEMEYKEKLALARKNGKLCVSDSIGFKRIQVTNDIFGMDKSKGYLQFGKSLFKRSDNEYIWFPHLTPNKEWDNSISDDWNRIDEKYTGAKALLKPEDDPNLDQNIKRYTFALYKDSLGAEAYRFIGIFKFTGGTNNHRAYERIYTEMNL